MSRWTKRAACFSAVVATLAPATGGTASAASALQFAAAAAPAAGQFAGLRQRLAITPAQQPQFAAFVAVIRHNNSQRAAFLQQNPPHRQRDALEEFRVRAAAAELDARGQRQLLSAFQSLYESLSPAQKRSADAVFAASGRSAPPRR